MAKRQASIYGFAITVLAVLLAIALLGLTGIIRFPFGDEFSRKQVFAEAGQAPCPIDATVLQEPQGTKLQILNASSISRGAGTLGERLAEIGYTIGVTDNATSPYKGTILIEAGPNGVDAAYSLAQYFGENVRVRLADIPDQTITVTIGESMENLPTVEDFQTVLAAKPAITAQADCVEVDPTSITMVGPQSAQSGSSQSAE